MTKIENTFPKGFLKEMEGKLTKEKEILEQELAKLGKKNPDEKDDYEATFPEYGDKDDENAAEVAQYAANLPLEQNLEKELRDLTGALDRMKKGTYGICKYCKEPMEEKRIMARPTSSACVACKKTLTQEL